MARILFALLAVCALQQSAIAQQATNSSLPYNQATEASLFLSIANFNTSMTGATAGSSIAYTGAIGQDVGQPVGTVQSLNITGPLVLTTPSNVNNLNFGNIALVSCDVADYAAQNLNPGDLVNTVISKISPHGGSQGALVLYSRTSTWCSYTNSAYALIFTSVNNSSAAVLVADIQQGASNATVGTIASANNTMGGAGGGSPVTSTSTSTTAIAMIVLYSITGIITIMFLLIIVSGAIRARRHPERYGPRNVVGLPRQSRARGMARAMLETLPIVKFGESEDPNKTVVARQAQDIELGDRGAAAHPDGMTPPTDAEASNSQITHAPVEATRDVDPPTYAEGEGLAVGREAPVLQPSDRDPVSPLSRSSSFHSARSVPVAPASMPPAAAGLPQEPLTTPSDPTASEAPATVASSSNSNSESAAGSDKATAAVSPPASQSAAPADPTVATGSKNADLGLACSVCTEDFVRGDNARVLPCDHKFHPDCIDPWLLNVSSTCPMCRVDLIKRDTASGGGSGADAAGGEIVGEGEGGAPTEAQRNRQSSGRLMSRYLDLMTIGTATPQQRLEVLRELRERRHLGVEVAAAEGEVAGDRRSRRQRLSALLRPGHRQSVAAQSTEALGEAGADGVA